MAISGVDQTLTAAFSFGILLQAAAGGLLLFFKGHGSTIFQDDRRLALVSFLFFSALWAQIDFINLMIPSSPVACQVTLVGSTLSDQLARVGIEQFLLWSVGHGTKVTAEGFLLQGTLGIRLVVGVVFVGFTRPEFAPVCVAHTSLLPIGIVVLALDIIITGVLIIRALSSGMLRDLKSTESHSQQEQSRALLLTMVGFTLWTGTSVAMVLGISSMLLIVRTTVPSIGLLFLVGIVAVSSGSLLSPIAEETITPEARSPFITPLPPSREIFYQNNSNGSPILGHNYSKSGSLFVVNPSATPRDSPTMIYRSDYQNETRGYTKSGGDLTMRAIGATQQDESFSKSGPGYRGSSGIFPSVLAASSMNANLGAVAPQIRPPVSGKPGSLQSTTTPPPISQSKRSLFSWSKQATPPTVRSLGISKPLMNQSGSSSAQPFARMQTIDLATAAINERERREGAAARSRLVAKRPAPQPPSLPAQDALRKSISIKRKEMPSRSREEMPTIASSVASKLSVEGVIGGSTSSASLSPGREEIRRRSPRKINNFDRGVDEKVLEESALQRTTTGLPSNPRSQRIPLGPDTGIGREQTIMFINNIVYDNPGMVKTIISEAPGIYASSNKFKEKSPFASYSTELKPSGSIIHRPRPYRRDAEKDRALFPSEASPRHKRSKSGSLIGTRKSILMSHPGSPTQLPPLPAPPTSASKLIRLLPNNTKSMTFDEKIQLLFPAPPGSTIVNNRRSSVPSLPRLPSVYMSDTPPANSPTEGEQQSRRASKRTTIASFGLQDAHNSAEAQGQDRQTYRFSANTYQNLADQVGDTWIPGIPTNEPDTRIPNEDRLVRVSHNYDVEKSLLTETTSSNASSHGVSIIFADHLDTLGKGLAKTIPYKPRQGSDEIVEVSRFSVSDGNRQSFLLDAHQALPGDKTPTLRTGPTWHRRIGDELPTFSQRRKQNTRSRKMPPPTPLLLKSKGRNVAVVVRASEPSPMDSPKRAIKEIQAQLKRFEEPNRGSVESLLRCMPDTNPEGADDANDNHHSRLRLLQDLEKEMGQQENQWQQMQNTLDRDSLSVLMTPRQTASAEEGLSRRSSQRSSRTPSQVVSRRARIRSSMTKGEDSSSTTSTQSSDNSRASVWQQRLANAQIEYLENAPAILRDRSLNFLSISKSQVGSPTAPDSVQSETSAEIHSESDVESSDTQGGLKRGFKVMISLWKPKSGPPKAVFGRLWNPPYVSSTGAVSSEPPARNVRPPQRTAQMPLQIHSSNLWSKPPSSKINHHVIGLWSSKKKRPNSIVTRRATHRPQRKSKRVTFLPDIVESPVPIPNKRDTLGIFQFPWGEISDSAVYRPPFNPALPACPVLNANLDARSRQLEPEPTEYSSSFFDDYDEQDDEDINSDDDFDETTLWEIASLLRSNDVPSKGSLLPLARKPSDIIEDYDDSTDFDTDSEAEEITPRILTEALRPIETPTFQLPIQPLVTTPKEALKCWASGATSALSHDLLQADPMFLDSNEPESHEIVRSKSHKPKSPGKLLNSQHLWSSSSSKESSMRAASLWSHNLASKTILGIEMATLAAQSTLLWVPQEPKSEASKLGLFSSYAERSIFQNKTANPVAAKPNRASRAPTSRLSILSSQSLWSPEQDSDPSIEWIFKSTATQIPEQNVSSSSTSVSKMWVPTKQCNMPFITGLFKIVPKRSDYRTCNSLPAAVNLISKPRGTDISLGRLVSTQLWSGSEVIASEHHWINESSIRPESPSIYSETSSGRSSPISDSSSVKSNSTKASSLWGSLGTKAGPALVNSHSPKKLLFENNKHPSGLPVRQSIAPSLATLRESRVLASRDVWEARALALEDAPAKTLRKIGDSTEQTKSQQITPRHQHSTVAALRENWNEALAEVVSSCIPRERTLTRPAAKKSDWDCALAKAISESKPRTQRPPYSLEMWKSALNDAVTLSSGNASATQYDSSKLHPVVSTKSFKSSTIETHPAVINYVERPSKFDYDVARRHPVFFVKSLATSANEVHPAAIGHVLSPETPRNCPTTMKLWTGQAENTRISDNVALWTKAAFQAPNKFHINKESLRRPSVFKSLQLSILESSGTWKAAALPVTPERNWLTVSKKAPTTWVAPKIGGEQEDQLPMAVVTKSSPDLFLHMKDEPKAPNVSHPLTLPRLSPTELSESRIASLESARDWLHLTPSTPKLVSCSKTWTAPLPVGSTEPKDTRMWESRSTPAPSSPTIFSNPHTNCNTKKREAPLKRIESTDMWMRSTEMPESPKMWLVNRRFSRVQFRY